jgi:Holliday junction resolvase-like predicted endonuclease
LNERGHSSADAKKGEALQLGVRSGTLCHRYLGKLGYVFIARNYMPSSARGELDLVGYDHDTLAIVEARMRLATPDLPALPELSVGEEKHELLLRTAEYFLRERHVCPCPVRFDVVGISGSKSRMIRLGLSTSGTQMFGIAKNYQGLTNLYGAKVHR